jgi:hypothetical protein
VQQGLAFGTGIRCHASSVVKPTVVSCASFCKKHERLERER